jgi:uncharacterized protein (UPF0332 family)
VGNELNPSLLRLLDERKISRITADRALVKKELSATKADLKDSQESLGLMKFKWATIQGYYAMFHAARALLFDRGYREKGHHALFIGIRELYAGKLERFLLQDFEHGIYLRQEADYGLKFSETGASDIIEAAKRFLDRAIALLDRS